MTAGVDIHAGLRAMAAPSSELTISHISLRVRFDNDLTKSSDLWPR